MISVRTGIKAIILTRHSIVSSMPMITCNNMYVHTVDHLTNVWRESTTALVGGKPSHSYYELSINDRMNFVAGTVIPSINTQVNMTELTNNSTALRQVDMTELTNNSTALRPSTAEVLAVPSYAAQLGLRPLGIFR
jgi:hypothetical protein